MPPTNMNVERPLHQMQYMLVPDIYGFDPEVTGGKVGFTNSARHTMSTTATRDDRNLVAVVMYSAARLDKFVDTRALLDFGFDEFVPFALEAEEFAAMAAVPVMQGGEEIGSAIFEHAGPFTALIHTSSDPAQLQIHRDTPRYYDLGYPAPYTISFELPVSLPFVPALLGAIELEPYLDIPVTAAMLPLEGRVGTAPFWLTALRVAGTTLGSVILIFAVFVIYRRRQIAKRKRRRMERFELNIRRAEQARSVNNRQISASGYYDSYTRRKAR